MSSKKRKIFSEEKFLKSDKEIEQFDTQTFYVKSSDSKKAYMVFYSVNEDKWYCDCLSFVYNMTDSNTKDCKHILRVKALQVPSI